MEGVDHENEPHVPGGGAARGNAHARGDNFSDKENHDLVSACQQVQISSRRQDLKFTATEWNAVFEAYRRIAPDSQRGVDMLRTRMKTMRSEFNNLKSLVNMSGWSWDWVGHKVIAPPGAWASLMEQNYNKWRYYPNKRFPLYKEFMKLVGTSSISGDFGLPSQSSHNSGTGSSDNPPVEEDGPVMDSEERERFDHQTSTHEGDNQTVEGGREDEPTMAEQPSEENGRSGTKRTGNRSASSNKRKSTDEAEGSRSRRAKKGIHDRHARDVAATDALGTIAEANTRLVQQNDEFLAIAQRRLQLDEAEHNKLPIDQQVEQVLKAFNLNYSQRFTIMDNLNPQRQRSFVNATTEEQKCIIGELIPSFFQSYNGGVNYSDAANGGANYWPYGPFQHGQPQR